MCDSCRGGCAAGGFAWRRALGAQGLALLEAEPVLLVDDDEAVAAQAQAVVVLARHAGDPEQGAQVVQVGAGRKCQ